MNAKSITMHEICNYFSCTQADLAEHLEVVESTVWRWGKVGEVPGPVKRWYESERRLNELAKEGLAMLDRARKL